MAEKIATRDAYGDTLAELGRLNKDIVVLDADLSKSTKTEVFAKEFPERFFNTGIAEQNMAGIAAGLAAAGKIPFISTFAIFATGRAFEQIRNTIAYPRLNVKIAATHAGITVGPDGASHQSVEDIALMRAIPGMTIINPADATETRFAVKAALDIDGPVYIRLGRHKVPVIFQEGDYVFKPGKGVVLREGKDATIISTGIMTAIALEAADILKNRGIYVNVVNIHTIKPIDEELIIQLAEETGAVITAEEHSIIGGLGSAVAEVLAESRPTLMKRIGLKDVFGQSGEPDELLKFYSLTPDSIASAVKDLIDKK
ncbi:1-deoxy-D-xylulose-5-phosphate synthase [Koleobacter methoxysyntrophicus]|uniref:1-deoxy-D-xylulose-5-phosphate synthase n=1 Tax=Koleobacter methoxysyntrophicus TaxID=2751313 RepID=A0A8A0RQY5_9FIRM|nr:transketolase family protein [Koleobacter methoxysyntrophicus]QSQ10374.1 1-deoxy-D-xylulose-5-phosphate synthase [Koleobacter methoxysyntrophicus]